MSGRRPGLYTIVAQSLFGAAIGVAAGYAYVTLSVPAKILEENRFLLGAYASAGAVVGVVGLRVLVLMRTLYRDYFRGES